MKKDFFDAMYKEMQSNKEVYLIFIDLGFPRVDEFKKAYPGRAFSTGASEQTALDIACGLALENKIPFVYTIAPFLLRGFETIRNYINYENLNIKLVGVGRGDDYSKDHGFSHDAKDIKKTFDLFENIKQYWPNEKEEIPDLVKELINNDKPSFISLRR